MAKEERSGRYVYLRW